MIADKEKRLIRKQNDFINMIFEEIKAGSNGFYAEETANMLSDIVDRLNKEATEVLSKREEQ